MKPSKPIMLSRASIGLAVRVAREAADLTLQQMSEATGMSIANVSRSENGLRDLAFSEVVAITHASRMSIDVFLQLVTTYERGGAVSTRHAKLIAVKAELKADSAARVAAARALIKAK